MNIVNEFYDGGASVTTSNSVADPAGPFAGLYTGSGGAISLVDIRGRTVVFAATAAGTFLKVACIRVNTTGTAATGVVGMYCASFKGPQIAQT